MPKVPSATPPPPIVLRVELMNEPSALILAEHSCDIIEGGVAALGAIAKLAAEATEQADSTVDIDWCGIETLLDEIGFEIHNGTFFRLSLAIADATRAEDEARDRPRAGGAR